MHEKGAQNDVTYTQRSSFRHLFAQEKKTKKQERLSQEKKFTDSSFREKIDLQNLIKQALRNQSNSKVKEGIVGK